MLTVIAGIVIGVPLAMYLLQDGMIFHPQPAPRIAPGPPLEAVQVPVGEGLVMSGWMGRAPGAARSGRGPLIIYFGGNAEEVSHMARQSGEVAPWAVLAVNYRGYGGNPGVPGEHALFQDALAIYDWAASRPDVDASRIVIMGRSLGSGVAVHVAAERRPAGVVLVTPYDSLRAVAGEIYPWLPVSLLLRHPFDALARAPAIDAPMLSLVAARDQVIAPRHARALFEAWRGPRQWQEFGGADHNSIAGEPGYWQAIRGFLAARSSHPRSNLIPDRTYNPTSMPRTWRGPAP